MNILFVYPDILEGRNWPGYFFVGVGSLSAVLKQNGHQTSLLHVTGPIEKRSFLSRIEAESPDLIAFSSTSPMFPLTRKFAGWLVEADLGIPTICGGLHPTIDPHEAIETPGIDVICRGEGEGAMLDFVTALERGEDVTQIDNLWAHGADGKVIRNPVRKTIRDLDTLPYPDRTIYDYRNLYHERENVAVFMVSRGCAYDCAYCCNHLLRSINGPGNKATRFRSVDNVIGEVKQVLKDYPWVEKLNFDDDILFLRKRWGEEFAERYGREIGLPFTCNARANLVTEEVVDQFVEAGCTNVKFGIESGNEIIANAVLKRQLANDDLRRAFRLCKERGLVTESFNMVGIPCETTSCVLDTIKLNAELGAEKMQCTIFQPYNGTELEKLSADRGFKRDEGIPTSYFQLAMDLDSISEAQVSMFRDHFKVLVRYYRLLMKLPDRASALAIRGSDWLLSASATATILNAAYRPMNRIYRRMFTLRVKLRIARKRLRGRVRGVNSVPLAAE